MSDFEKEWSQRLAQAEQSARRAGRADVVAYLNLRADNDGARAAGIEWLLATFTSFAGEMNRQNGASVQLEHHDSHRFRVGNSTMVGTQLTLRNGIRHLSVAAGWPRMPADGIVRGGGLALARINHFGHRQADEEMLLLRDKTTGAPQWFIIKTHHNNAAQQYRQLHEQDIRGHLARLLK